MNILSFYIFIEDADNFSWWSKWIDNKPESLLYYCKKKTLAAWLSLFVIFQITDHNCPDFPIVDRTLWIRSKITIKGWKLCGGQAENLVMRCAEIKSTNIFRQRSAIMLYRFLTFDRFCHASWNLWLFQHFVKKLELLNFQPQNNYEIFDFLCNKTLIEGTGRKQHNFYAVWMENRRGALVALGWLQKIKKIRCMTHAETYANPIDLFFS